MLIHDGQRDWQRYLSHSSTGVVGHCTEGYQRYARGSHFTGGITSQYRVSVFLNLKTKLATAYDRLTVQSQPRAYHPTKTALLLRKSNDTTASSSADDGRVSYQQYVPTPRSQHRHQLRTKAGQTHSSSFCRITASMQHNITSRSVSSTETVVSTLTCRSLSSRESYGTLVFLHHQTNVSER